jgi:hypothetical protein
MYGYDAFGRAWQATGGSVSGGGSSDGRRALSHSEALEARCDRLAVLCEAMWTLLRDQLNLTDEQLLDRINEVDLTDGRLDGKVERGSAITCHKCNRNVARKFAKCMYCGEPLAHDPFA